MPRFSKIPHRTHGLEARVTVMAALMLGSLASCALAESPILGPTFTVDDVLDALQATGKNLKSLTASVKTDDYDTNQGSDITRHGKVTIKIDAHGNAQLHLIYNDRQFGEKKPVAEKQEYVLDDGWAVKRDFTTSNETRKQLAKPGENLDLFQLGKSPIPMPIGQDKKDVHGNFDVTIAPADKDDPAGTLHLVLTPKPGSKFANQYKTVDIWVDCKLKLPVRIATTDQKGSLITTHDLTDVKINPEVPAGEFKLPQLEPNWHSTAEPL